MEDTSIFTSLAELVCNQKMSDPLVPRTRIPPAAAFCMSPASPAKRRPETKNECKGQLTIEVQVTLAKAKRTPSLSSSFFFGFFLRETGCTLPKRQHLHDVHRPLRLLIDLIGHHLPCKVLPSDKQSGHFQLAEPATAAGEKASSALRRQVSKKRLCARPNLPIQDVSRMNALGQASGCDLVHVDAWALSSAKTLQQSDPTPKPQPFCGCCSVTSLQVLTDVPGDADWLHSV